MANIETHTDPDILSGRSDTEEAAHRPGDANVFPAYPVDAGKPLPLWVKFLRGVLKSQIARHVRSIDAFVIGAQDEQRSLHDALQTGPARQWRRYLSSLIAVLAASLVGEVINPFVTPPNLVMLYLPAVVFVAVRYGRGPAALASLLSVMAFDFFFVPPRYTFVVGDVEYFLTFFGLLVAGLVISSLAAQARDQMRAAHRRQQQTAALYDLSRELAGTAMLQPILEVIVAFTNRMFARPVCVLLPDHDKLALRAKTPGMTVSANDLAAASWVFTQGQEAGHGTNISPATGATYLPLETGQGIAGVLGVGFMASDAKLTSEQRYFLEATASISALAIERAELAEKARQMALMVETEKFQTALLNSISHDLRTPLASITGSLSSLEQDAAYLDEASRHVLLTTALEQAEQLNRLVGNLLDMTRLESGALSVTKKPVDVQELVGVALQELESRLQGRQVILSILPGLPPVPMDLVLMARVLVNVLDNAIKYSEPGSPIEISGRQKGYAVELEIADQGVGIPAEDMGRVFDKFYRIRRRDAVSGTGLGLSISRGFVEAHGGSIVARARADRTGTVITISLPLAVVQELFDGE